MKFFNKQELIGVSLIFLVLIFMSVPNFAKSIKRARDMTRKDDLGRLTSYLSAFQSTYKEFPASTDDGKIIACYPDGVPVEVDKNKDGKIDIEFVACEWGASSFIGNLPEDPNHSQGVAYVYLSNSNRYQLLASLEAVDDDEYSLGVYARNVICGNKICNAGRGYSDTPIDKSLQQYEDELYAKSLKK